MNHGRKVLEAENKRMHTPRMYSVQQSDGYLRNNRAFPSTHGNRSGTSEGDNNINNNNNNNNNNNSSTMQGDVDSSDGASDEDYSDDADGRSDRRNVSTVGGGEGPPRHYPRNINSYNNLLKQGNKQQLHTPRNSSLSPLLKKNRTEMVLSPMRKDTRSGSINNNNNNIKTVTNAGLMTSRYAAAPCVTKKPTPMPPMQKLLSASHYAAPVTGPARKDYSPRKQASPSTLGLRLPMSCRMGREPATAGISPCKVNKSLPGRNNNNNNDNNNNNNNNNNSEAQRKRIPPIEKEKKEKEEEMERGGKARLPSNIHKSTVAPSSSSSLFPHWIPKNTTTNTTTAAAGANNSHVYNMKPAASVQSSAAAAAAARTIIPTSPPLRAAVSPHSLSVYRHYRPASESSNSLSQVPQSAREKSSHAEVMSPEYPGETRADTLPSLCKPPLSTRAADTEGTLSPVNTAKMSPPRYDARENYETPPPPPPTATVSYEFYDCSGFVNPENDCYACSVLTLLLRSPLFCRALPDTYATDNNNNNEEDEDEESGYGEMYTVRDMTSKSRSYNERKRIRTFSCSFSFSPSAPTSSYSSSPCRRREKNIFLSVHHVLLYFMHLLKQPERIRHGISMSPLHSFFPSPFFSGEQQDAHEFFMDLIRTLEEESIEEEKKKKKKKREKNNNNSNNNILTAEAEDEDEEGERNREESTTDVNNTSHEDNSQINASDVWINKLVQGNLLNIVRCGNKNCEHEIATRQIYANLCLNLQSKLHRETNVSPTMQTCTERIDTTSEITPPSISSFPPSPPRPPPASSEKEKCKHNNEDIQMLLNSSLQYVKLDKYVCDVCGSSQDQNQGGCLVGTVAPLLVLQLNRYSTTFSLEMGVQISKDKTPVSLNEELVLYSLCEEGQFDDENKKLMPCVREAERVARERGKYVNYMTTHEGGNERSPAHPCNAEGHDTNGSHAMEQNCGKDEKEQGENEEEEKEEEGEENNACMYVNAIRYVYRLRGVLRHIGSTPFAGHYVTEFAADATPSRHAKYDSHNNNNNNNNSNSNEEGTLPRTWMIANDTQVSVLPSKSLQKRRTRSTDSYLLLYEKVAEGDVSCPVWYVLPGDSD